MNLTNVPTPCYVVDKGKIQRNLDILASIKDKSGCKILMALKGFSMFSLFPQILTVVDGLSTSSLDECLLAYEEGEGEIHLYAPAYPQQDFPKLLGMADHIVFNSFSQWQRYREAVHYSKKKISCAIRINPEHSEVKTAIYDPCGKYSRLGVTLTEFQPDLLGGIDGLHFHTLCELNADSLERTLKVVEEKFGPYLRLMKWINFGGGHHITRPDYDCDLLVNLIRHFQDKYKVQVYLEPGEAIALNTGYLVAQVLDIIHNKMDIAILDTSAAAHMPDVLEMPYRPEIIGAGPAMKQPYTYRLGGLTCLAGDIIGDYSFPEPLSVGQKLIFCDMAHYTMVKNNTFNGVRLPSIAIFDPESEETTIVRRFRHEDYKNRLS